VLVAEPLPAFGRQVDDHRWRAAARVDDAELPAVDGRVTRGKIERAVLRGHLDERPGDHDVGVAGDRLVDRLRDGARRPECGQTCEPEGGDRRGAMHGRILPLRVVRRRR
jgi:hypothetical protein